MPRLSDAQIAGAARSGGFSGNDVAIAVAVALAESGGNPNATHRNTNGSIDHGLWQINTVNASVLASGNWANPNDNARMAKRIKDSQGWRAWTTYSHGTYLAFMPRAKKAAGNPVDPGPGANPTASPAGLPGIGQLGSWLTSSAMWWRIGEFIVGVILVILALFKMTGDNKLSDTTKTLVKTGVKLAVIPK